jgi:homoserine dehydrogenase
VETIEGCFSGTLNFLCAALDAGQTFSEGLRAARDRGFTEPDPRDDLDGQDVARKAIILARAAGVPVEAADARREPFVPVDRAEECERFLRRAGDHDGPLRERVRAAASRGLRLRYVARVAPGEGCRAGLAEVPADSPLGRLAGPENVFVFTTGRYHHHPLVVSGPGAGPEVTAAGAFADLMTVVRAVARGGNGASET